ncbi:MULTISPECIES: hypothetical protein [Pedobacter]|uniref:hypothetical protein n=1 Tax=Pedobacter TaxID=84567 RepID=UPI001E3646EC|nr:MULTISPECIES: hypothetical protein [Pedobacter]
MKIKILVFGLAICCSFAACNGKQADQENADKMNQYTDSTSLDTTTIDSNNANKMADSTTNAPADANH